MQEFDEDAILKTLEFLTPQNMQLLIGGGFDDFDKDRTARNGGTLPTDISTKFPEGAPAIQTWTTVRDVYAQPLQHWFKAIDTEGDSMKIPK